MNETESDENNKGYSDLRILDPRFNRLTNAQVAQEFLQVGTFATVDDHLMMWDLPNMNWIDAEEGIKKQIVESWKDDATVSKVKEIIELMKIQTVARLGDLEKENVKYGQELPNHLFPLQNAILNARTCQIEPLGPWYFFNAKMPLIYDASAKCDKIDAVLKSLVSEEYLPMLYEIPAYCLCEDRFIQKAIMIYGEGANGKRIYTGLIEAFLGLQNISHESLHDLNRREFVVANLIGKLANIDAEISGESLGWTEIFRKLTGNDVIDCHKKHVQEAIPLNRAPVLIFGCNQWPKQIEDTPAFYRRWAIIPFDRTFVGQEDHKNLLKELITPEELSGFLNKVLEAKKRLEAQGDFSESMDIDETREFIEVAQNLIKQFLNDMVVFEQEAAVLKQDLYDSYRKYCGMKKKAARMPQVFSQQIKVLDSRISDYRPRENDKRPTMWRGIRLKEGTLL